MLAVDPACFSLASALAEFARVGYARLGRVVSAEALAALGARVDDLMSARVQHDGMFFQRDSATGRYEERGAMKCRFIARLTRGGGGSSSSGSTRGDGKVPP